MGKTCGETGIPDDERGKTWPDKKYEFLLLELRVRSEHMAFQASSLDVALLQPVPGYSIYFYFYVKKNINEPLIYKPSN